MSGFSPFLRALSFWKSRSWLVRGLIAALPAAALLLWLAVPKDRDRALLIVGPEQPQEVREKIRSTLEQKGIRVQVRANGLFVREELYPQVVMQLSGQGILDDAELFKFLDESNFTSTHWQMDKRWQVALQRKLELMIRTLDSIQEAHVQITPAGEQKTLGREAEAAKASVIVTLKEGRSGLTGSETQSIAHLISTGIRGLKPEGVKIMDRQGRLYVAPGDAPTWPGISERHTIERACERGIEEKALKVVASFYPKASATASVKLSGKRILQKETQYTSEPAPPQATKTVEEVASGSGIKGHRALTLPDAPSESTAVERRRQVEIEPGEIETASIAVVIVGTASPQAESAEMERLKALVSNATGVSQDQINIQFTEPLTLIQRQDAWPMWAVPAALGGAMTLAFLGILLRRRPSKALIERALSSPRLAQLDPARIAALFRLATDAAVQAASSRLDRPLLEEVLLQTMRRRGARASEIRQAISMLD